MKENNKNTEDFNDNEQTYDVITLTEDDGTEKDYFVVDAIEVDGTNYILVVDSDAFDEEEVDAFLLKEVQEDGEDVVYESVVDDNEYNKVIILLQDNETADYEIQP